MIALGCGETSTDTFVNLGSHKVVHIGGGKGVQKCGEDRQSWEECQCAPDERRR